MKIAFAGTLVKTCESSTLPFNADSKPFVFAIVKSPSAMVFCLLFNDACKSVPCNEIATLLILPNDSMLLSARIFRASWSDPFVSRSYPLI